MEYPPVKPYQQALHELRKGYDYEKYKEAFPRVLNLAGHEDFAVLDIHYYYIRIYVMMGHGEEAQLLVQAARAYECADPVLHKTFMLLIDAYTTSRSDSQRSNMLIDEAISLLPEKVGELYFTAILIKARNYFQLKKFDETIQFCTEIIDHAGNLLDIIAQADKSLALVHGTLNDRDEAERYYKKALDFYKDNNYIWDIAGSYTNLGGVSFQRYLDQKEGGADPDQELLRKAIEYTTLALEMLTETTDYYNRVIALMNLGVFYTDAKHFDEAARCEREAVAVGRLSQSKEALSLALLNLGGSLGVEGKHEEALNILEECLPLVDFLQGSGPASLYSSLTAACKDLGLWEKGFRYSQKEVEFLRKFEKEAKTGIQYQNKILSEKLNLENELHELQLKSLEEKMRAQAAQLVTQTELLAKFRDELREIARKHPSTDPDWREVKEKLKELPCKQIDWEKFDAEFKAVHPEFTQKLYEQYPALTPTEVKMCSLLRLNLKSHEIARLFCLSERSVETHRFNIRKKMNIGREQNLVNFLNTL